MSRSGIVNVRMVITEEKILSNIEKVQKMINPNSKKQIVQLEEDAYFKDLIEAIKTYLIEYPKKKNFPSSVYKAAYGLVEFATNQFEENTKRIEELIETVDNKEDGWKDKIKNAEADFSEDIIDTLNILGKCKTKTSQNYTDAMKLLNARVNNLESNLHIEIDMERIEDRSKALSYIGIEVADALKTIPTPVEEPTKVEKIEEQPEVEVQKTKKVQKVQNVETVQQETEQQAQEQYVQETTFEKKPSLWQRIKNSKIVRAIRYAMKIRVVLQYPALPEGKSENY